MATTRDVARLAGVSIATVSRVLSGAVRVRLETRDRVLLAVEQCRYVPDQNALAISKLSAMARAQRKKYPCASA